MSTTGTYLCIICMACVCLISLVSSHLYKREHLISSELMSLVSFGPGFVLAGVAALGMPLHANGGVLGALVIKNLLYCFSFYFRYESLRKFGPFVGALMLGTQPIAVFILGLIILGEGVTLSQGTSMGLATIALLILAINSKSTGNAGMGSGDFVKYYVLPTMASTLAIIWDRYFLAGHISGNTFFILDRLMLMPSFFIALTVIKRKSVFVGFWRAESIAVIRRNWQLLFTVGVLFTLSVYAYNLALTKEKVALVGLFRNAAYPIAAFFGTFIYRRKTTTREWVSLSLILVSVVLGVA